MTGVKQSKLDASYRRHSQSDRSQVQAENARLKLQFLLLNRLSQRIGSSLDLESVLQQVVDGACELTGAQYGALALLSPAGEFQRLFTHGLTENERTSLGELPHGRGVIGLLHEMESPLRVADLSAHERFVGFPAGHPAMTSFLGARIQDDGAVQGSLYLADKADASSFSSEDEEILSLFNLQAASAIQNARQFEEAQASRAEAEEARLSLQRSEARLREQTAELEKLRTDLLAAIAHEFRTPLSAIRMAVGILKDPALEVSESQGERLLESISQSATLMQRLVTDLVDLARYQSGKAPLQIRRFDACALTRSMVQTVAGLLESRGQTVAIESPARLWVHGDRVRLSQALLNLLSNAMKFAPEGSEITVRVAARGGYATWSVTDQGPGIPANLQPYLFERFFTVVRSDSARASGLALVYRLRWQSRRRMGAPSMSRPNRGEAAPSPCGSR